MLARLNNCLAIFASNREFVLCVTMTHSAMQTRAHNRERYTAWLMHIIHVFDGKGEGLIRDKAFISKGQIRPGSQQKEVPFEKSTLHGKQKIRVCTSLLEILHFVMENHC